MGLMTLIARKINPEKHQQAQPRAPPYERKASTKSPVRLVQTVSPSESVSTASASHGASKPFLKESRPREHPSSPLSQSSSTESAAPAPVILGFRGDGIPSRPVTSNGKQRQADARRGDDALGLLPTTPKLSSRFSYLVSPRPRSPLPRRAKPEATVQTRPPTHRAQSSMASSKLAKSFRTDGGTKGYVDLLDAQSEFKPADFYSRVRASGARDYGEDVADRNIGANGYDLDSKPVQAFYAVSPKVPHHVIEQHRPFSSWNHPSSNLSEDEDDHLYQYHTMKQTSMDSALWSKTLNSSHQAFFSYRNKPTVLSAASSKKGRTLHRQSFNVLPSSAPMGMYSTPSLAEMEVVQSQERVLDRKSRGRSLQVSVNDANRLVSAWDTTSPESGDGSSSGITYSPPNITRPVTSGGLPRGVSSPARRSGVVLSGHEYSEEGPKFGINTQPILSPQPTSFRLSASLASSAFTASSKRPSTMHGMHSVRHPRQVALESHSTMPDLSNLPFNLKEKALNFKEDWHDDLSDRESAPSPFIKTRRSRSQSQDNAREYSRANSVATPRPRSQAGEPEEQTPGRASSARNWSMTSTAPTMSSSSSATCARPHSRHTANTSIDLSIAGLSSTLNSSLVSISSDAGGQRPWKMPYLKPDLERSPVILQSPLFNIDDYVSSDDDSAGVQVERGESDEDLLFNNGYGANGIQLPGLEDAFAAPAPVVLMRSPRMSVAKSSEEYRRAYGEPPSMDTLGLRREASDDALPTDRSSSRRRRSNGPAGAPIRKTDSKDGSDQKTQSPAKRSETRRLSAILGAPAGHTHHSSETLGSNSRRHHPNPNHLQHIHLQHSSNVGKQVIEEEKFEKVDIATAIRLRKESKAKKRASLMSTTSQARGRGLAKTTSIENEKSSSADGVDGKSSHQNTPAHATAALQNSPNITEVPELAEDMSEGQEDTE